MTRGTVNWETGKCSSPSVEVEFTTAALLLAKVEPTMDVDSNDVCSSLLLTPNRTPPPCRARSHKVGGGLERGDVERSTVETR